ncbi:M48 family metallopeptidase [Chitinophaga varians]|uniref:M48 family metallopeptidase n=1 Tax=Chitinophaga varians TaxID=2202339 RepID=A0A847RAD5_9BACT|nr:M48 family metallopeptidase [Chitinophaga varians]
MAPVGVLDYIITYEMVHLLHPNHSSEFWTELDEKMPNYLKVNGVKLAL